MISVCISTIRAGTLEAAARSILNQTWTDWELIIVAQGNDEALMRSCETVRNWDTGGRIRLVHLAEKGLSRARNAGAAAARGDILAFTDDDCEAREDWLVTVARYFAADAKLGALGGALVAPSPRPGTLLSVCPQCLPEETLWDAADKKADPPRTWDWAGGNFALSRACWETVGVFDPCLGAGSLFPAAEDTDYLLRMEQAGIRMKTTPESVILHTSGRRYGWKSVANHTRNYALGNGALAAKMTLAGDPRGQVWLERETRPNDSLMNRLRQIPRLPVRARRLRFFCFAYERCLAEYRFDASRDVLMPLAPTTPTDPPSSVRSLLQEAGNAG
jgi:glycosyltransferase involved in cell wall biosynthesis